MILPEWKTADLCVIKSQLVTALTANALPCFQVTGLFQRSVQSGTRLPGSMFVEPNLSGQPRYKRYVHLVLAN